MIGVMTEPSWQGLLKNHQTIRPGPTRRMGQNGDRPMHQPNRLEAIRTLRYANLDAAFATAFATLVSGTFLVGFIK